MPIDYRQLWFAALLLVLPLSALAQKEGVAALYQAPMTWTDDQGKSVPLAKWLGKVVIITMMYSACRKYCPLTLAKLGEIQRLLDQRKLEAEFVVLSYDPQNDTWQSWAEYRKTHNLSRNNWHFLTGSLEDTKAISQLLGIDYWLYDEHVMHNFKIIRLDQNGFIRKTLDWDAKEEAESLITDLAKP